MEGRSLRLSFDHRTQCNSMLIWSFKKSLQLQMWGLSSRKSALICLPSIKDSYELEGGLGDPGSIRFSCFKKPCKCLDNEEGIFNAEFSCKILMELPFSLIFYKFLKKIEEINEKETTIKRAGEKREKLLSSRHSPNHPSNKSIEKSSLCSK